MQEVLRTLNTSPVHPIEKEFNHRIVAEMRKGAGVDMPPADVPASGPVTVVKRKPAAVAQVLPETSGTSDNVGPADVGSSANAQASGQVIDANNTSEPHAAVLVEHSEEWYKAAENALCVGKETPSVGENPVATPAATSRTEDNSAAVSTSTVVPATSEPQKTQVAT